jgi:hypothetical protein
MGPWRTHRGARQEPWIVLPGKVWFFTSIQIRDDSFTTDRPDCPRGDQTKFTVAAITTPKAQKTWGRFTTFDTPLHGINPAISPDSSEFVSQPANHPRFSNPRRNR